MNHYETDSAACDLRVHGFIWGKQRPRQNNADENGTCRKPNAAWAPGKYAHTHTQRDGDDDNDGALSGLGVRASREQESCVQCATHTLAGRCRARRERRRCCRRRSRA